MNATRDFSVNQGDRDNLVLRREIEDMARRRGQRKGYLYRRGPSWFLQFRTESQEIDPKTGKFKRPIKTEHVGPAVGPGKMTRKQAESVAYRDHLALLDQKTRCPASMKTIADFVKERFRPDVILSCKPSGQAHYEYLLGNHVLPAIGSYRMCDLNPQIVQDLVLGKLKQGLSPATVVHLLHSISAVFRHAKRMRAFSGDFPTEGVRHPPVETAEKQALTWPQVVALAACIGRSAGKRSKHAPKPDLQRIEALNAQLGALVIILAQTGLRIGEAMGLRWKRVNLADHAVIVDGESVKAYSIAIHENYVRGKYGTLKSKKSRRMIPLSTETWYQFSRLQQLAGVINPDSPVFSSTAGTPLDQHNIASRFLKPAGKRPEVAAPWVSWHVFRHTAASLADQAGMTVSERQRVLGHSAESMALHYTHADLEKVRGQLENIGKGSVN